MALAVYNEAVNEFSASIGDVRRYVQFVSVAHHLRPRIGQMLDVGTLQPEHRNILTNYMSQKDYSVVPGFNGLIVVIAAGFEQFMRRLLRDGVLWLNRSVVRFDGMPGHLRHQNLVRSGHALTSVMDPPAEVDYDYEAICRNLGTCWKGGGDLVLNADAFTAYLPPLTAKNIEEVLNDRVRVKLDWDAFGRNLEIQKATGQTRTRDATKETEARLTDFIKKRNRIAHAGTAGPTTTEEELNSIVTFFEAFVPVLAANVEEGLKRVMQPGR